MNRIAPTRLHDARLQVAMKSLGYPMTWVTDCFINGGCGATVFAHTNGHGDFVLFDELGWPWPVHDCYVNRYCADSAVWSTDRQSGRLSCSLNSILKFARDDDEYREVVETRLHFRTSRPSRRDIKRVEPGERIASGTFEVQGYVSDVHSRHRPKPLAALGGLGERITDKVIGNRHSQITIITGDFQSFTALADLSQIVIAKGDFVSADLRSAAVVTYHLFVCEQLKRLSIEQVSTWGRSK